MIINEKYETFLEKFPRLDFVENDQHQKMITQYLNLNKFYLNDLYLMIWQTDLLYLDIISVKESSKLTPKGISVLLNYFYILTHIQNLKILFTMIEILNGNPEELEYQQMKANNFLMVILRSPVSSANKLPSPFPSPFSPRLTQKD